MSEFIPPPEITSRKEMENSTADIIYGEITLWSEWKIASGSSYALPGNKADDVKRMRQEG